MVREGWRRRGDDRSLSRLACASATSLFFKACCTLVVGLVHSISHTFVYTHTHIGAGVRNRERATGCRGKTSLSCRRRALVRPHSLLGQPCLCAPHKDANNYSYLDFFSQRDSLWNSGRARARKGDGNWICASLFCVRSRRAHAAFLLHRIITLALRCYASEWACFD